MALPRSELISDLATPGLPLDLHIPEAEGDSLNLLVKLLYGEATELPEEALPQLRSVCKALGLGNWLEEVLLTGKEAQLEFHDSKMVARKEENSEPLRDLLDLSDLTSTRRSPRLQPLRCKLCDSNHYSRDFTRLRISEFFRFILQTFGRLSESFEKMGHIDQI